MSREIKFRAWDYVLKTMSEPFHPYYTRQFMPPPLLEYGGPDIELLEFTGLQDKNGIDIYEGDIVCPLEINGTIAIAEIKYYLAGFIAQHFAGEMLSVSASYMGPNIEVIGNIYENKDKP